MEKVESELLVVCDVELLNIELREYIECTVVLDNRKSVNFINLTDNSFSLLIKSAAGNEHSLCACVVLKSCRDNELSKSITAKTHSRNLEDTLNIVVSLALIAADAHPAAAEAADNV